MRARSQSSRGFRYLRLISAITPVLLAVVPGCSDTINNSYTTIIERGSAAGEGGEGSSQPHPTAGTAGSSSHPDGGSPEGGGGNSTLEGGAGGEVTAQGGEGGQPDDGHALYPNAPYADIDVASQELNLFGKFGTKFWFGVSQEQLDIMNNGDPGGGPFPGPFGDPYTPGGGSSDGPFVDHLWVTGNDGHTADYGKVKVKVVGQSSRRAWSPQSIPNLNVDSNDFVQGQLINGFEHLRLNNAQVGNIFREWMSLTIYSKLNYPAPYVSYAKIGSNVWAKGIEIPMVLVERYKRRFCERFKEWGGGCNNMWEMYGQDFGGGGGGGGGKIGMAINGFYDDPNNCQFDTCEDTTRVRELDTLLTGLADGPGFKEATADYIDWPAFHRFQCSEWLMWIGDDALHNMNNIVLAEGKDGKFRYLPYSTDISLGHEWDAYKNTPLPGYNRIARGCQADESCWADTISACEDVIADFKAMDPLKMADDLNAALDAAGMLRPGDDVRFTNLHKWFEDRLGTVSAELDKYRAGPNPPLECKDPLVDCGGYCDYPEYCPQQCKPPVGKLAAAALPPEMMGAAGAGPIIDPPIDPGAGGAGGGPICPMIQNYPVKL